MLDTRAFGQIVVSSQPQAGDGVELTFTGRQKDDRQLRRLGAQLAAEFETAFNLDAEAHVDDYEVRKSVRKTRERFLAVAKAGDAIPLAPQTGQVVVANGAIVFDDGYELGR